jgi:hypothetical protein
MVKSQWSNRILMVKSQRSAGEPGSATFPPIGHFWPPIGHFWPPIGHFWKLKPRRLAHLKQFYPKLPFKPKFDSWFSVLIAKP